MAVPGVPSFQDKLVAMLPRLRVHALSLTRNRASADDLVHDTVCNALAAQSTYVHDTNFAAWMHLILRNRFISNGRKRRETSDIDDVPAKFLATEPTNGRRLEIQELDAALQRLRPNQRQALLMVAIDGLSYEALAETIGCALGTAKSRVFRARRQLELALAGDAPCSGDDRRGAERIAAAGTRSEQAARRHRAPVRAATPLPPVVSNAPESLRGFQRSLAKACVPTQTRPGVPYR